MDICDYDYDVTIDYCHLNYHYKTVYKAFVKEMAFNVIIQMNGRSETTKQDLILK